ncbi:MAG: sensor histidine kinase [Chloroflexi bacterium]|nr:sensor histidine kinase [Chloroflexota bacterium]
MQVKRTVSVKPVGRRFALHLADLRVYLWGIVLYALLFYPLVPLFASGDEPWSTRAAVVALVALFALSNWMLMFGQSEWQARVDRMLPFLCLNLVLATALVRLDPMYGFAFLFTTGYAFRFLPARWAVLVAVLAAALAEGERLASVFQAHTPAILLQVLSSSSGLVLGILAVAWIAQFARTSRERQALLERLQATQGELALAERQAGTLEERARLGREIHDTLVQGLVSIVMHLEAAEQTLPPDASASAQHLDQARRAARDNLAEARRFVWALQPTALERVALPKALARAAERWQDENHMPVAVSVTGEVCALTPELDVTLLRAAQESLANVSKHAHAHQVNLTLSYMSDQIVLDVDDDGVGFDLTHVESDRQTDGFGLAGMRQRVERLGGRMSIESTAGEGTTLVVSIPIANRENG